ncbi:MAG: hypothetical protein ACR2N5_06410 [Solirubrobacterales bacterium]
MLQTMRDGLGRRSLIAGVAALCAAAVLLGVSASRTHAAVEVGETTPPGAEPVACLQDTNLVQEGSTDPSFEVPVGGGVITEWRHLGAALGARGGGLPGSARLLLWRPEVDTSYTLAGRSAIEAFGLGLNTFETRIPVAGGELLGLRSVTDIGICGSTGQPPAEVVFLTQVGTDLEPGQTEDLPESEAATRLNVAATLEPDADADGYGDESQDVEVTVGLRNKLKPKKKGFPVKVSCGGTECDAEIKGKASAKTSGGSSAAASKRITYKLKPKTISVGAGETLKTKVKLRKSKKSTKKLAKLLKKSSKGSKLKLTVSAENSIGSSDKAKDKAKLKG